MRRLLYGVIVHYLGHGTTRPKLAAVLRLVILLALALSVCSLATKSAQNLQLAPFPDFWPILAHSTIAVQIVVALSLLCVSSFWQKSATDRWLATLPLATHVLWFLHTLPNHLVTWLVLIMVAPPLGIIGNNLGLPMSLYLLGVMVGGASGFALLHRLPQRANRIRMVVAPAIIALELWILALVRETVGEPRSTFLSICCIAVAVAAGAFWLFGYCNLCKALTEYTPPRSITFRLRRSGEWYMVKLLRNRPLQLSLLTAFLLSSLCAFALQKSPLKDPAMAAWCGALIAASSAADFRATSRKQKPAEIMGVQGVDVFYKKSMITYLFVGLAVSPLMGLLIILYSDATQTAAYLFQIITGAVVGNTVGTYIVPQKHDISAQFLAVFMSYGVLWGVQELAATNIIITELVWLLLCCIAAEIVRFGIEYSRNKFMWRLLWNKKQ